MVYKTMMEIEEQATEYISLTDIQEEMLNIMKDVIRFFDEQHINYVVTGGTALGAVRHQGFIPWDDDADIALARDDYEFFVKHYVPGSEAWELLSLEHAANWYYSYARVANTHTMAVTEWAKVNNGIYIDIFPIDALPTSKFGQRVKYGQMKYLDLMRNSTRRLAIRREEPYWYLKWLFILLAKIHTTNQWARQQSSLAKHTNAKYHRRSTARSLYVVQGINGMREIFPTTTFDHTVFMPFEDTQVKVPADYEKYLTQLYGDWQVIPTGEERKSHAKFVHV